MYNILIFPLPEAGHVLPTLALARHLCSRGCRVVYLTAPQFRYLLDRVGAALEPLVAESVEPATFSGPHIWNQFAPENTPSLQRERLAKLFRSAQEKYGCDLVLLDRLLALKYDRGLAASAGRDRCVFFSTSLINWDDNDWEDIEVPTMTFCPINLEVPKFRRLSPRLHYVEPALRDMDDPSSLPAGLRMERPLVLATFGSQSAKYRRQNQLLQLIRELAERHSDFEFVLSTGTEWDVPAASDNERCENLFLCTWLPQRLLLSKASVLLTHGGLGSVKEAIAAGVPMITLPLLYDQPFNSMRVRYHKLGEAIFPEQWSIDTVDAALRVALSGAYAGGIAAMREHFLAMERAKLSQLLIDNRLATVENEAKCG